MLRRVLFVLPFYSLLIAIGIYSREVTRSRIAENVFVANQQAVVAGISEEDSFIEGLPAELFVPAIDLSIEVEKGVYDSVAQSWSLSGTKAHYADVTKKLNNLSGMTMIYGHYNPTVFKKTDGLKIGDLVEVKTADGTVFVYEFKESSVVLPNNTELFAYEGDPKLTIITCTGNWFEKRRIMDFDLIAVREI